MKPKCAAAVSQAAGRPLSAQEQAGIDARVLDAMKQLARKDPTAWRALSEADRLNEGAKLAAQQVIHDAAKKAQRLQLTIAAHDRLGSFVAGAVAKGMKALDAVERTLVFNADGRSKFMSAETWQKGVRAQYQAALVKTLEAVHPKLLGLMDNADMERAVVTELYGRDSGNKVAKDAAQQFKDVAEQMRQRFNRAGGDVHHLEDWAVPQLHSQIRVGAVGMEKWVRDVLPMVDREKYVHLDGTRYTDVEMADFLSHAYQTIATGGVNNIEPGVRVGSGMRANRGNESRQIHFAGPDEYLQYQAAYGAKGFYHTMMGHVSSLARDIALTETYGPNPDHLFAFLRDKALQEQALANPAKAGRASAAAAHLDDLYRWIAGKSQPIANEKIAQGFDTLRSWLMATRLGSAVITAIPDEGTLRMTAFLNNLPQLQVLRAELAFMNPANAEHRAQLRRAGLALDSLTGDLNRWGEESLAASFSSRLANATIRASGLEALDDARRGAFGATMYDAIGKLSHENARLADLDPTDHRMLHSMGISETDWSVWRQAELEDWKGSNGHVLTPESIARIPDAKLEQLAKTAGAPDLAGGGGTRLTPQQLRDNAISRLLGLTYEEMDMSVMRPGAREREMMGAGGQRGNLKGELVRSFFLFKSYPIALIAKHFARGWGYDGQSATQTAGGRAAYIAGLAIATTVLGAVSLEINELLSGRNPRNLFDTSDGKIFYRNWIAAFLKGGSMGIYGDFLFSNQAGGGTSPISSIAGPLLGLSEEMLNLTQGNMVQYFQGKDTKIGAEATRFAKGMTPGASLWYAKAALDHLIFQQAAEWLTPGTNARTQQRSLQQYHQSYWWPPGAGLDHAQPPNLGTIAGR